MSSTFVWNRLPACRASTASLGHWRCRCLSPTLQTSSRPWDGRNPARFELHDPLRHCSPNGRNKTKTPSNATLNSKARPNWCKRSMNKEGDEEPKNWTGTKERRKKEEGGMRNFLGPGSCSMCSIPVPENLPMYFPYISVDRRDAIIPRCYRGRMREGSERKRLRYAAISPATVGKSFTWSCCMLLIRSFNPSI